MSFTRCFARLPDALADLVAWGRAPTGEWWGLVGWESRVIAGSRHIAVSCSAWVPAATLRPSQYETVHYPAVPRLRLPADDTAWPALVWPAGTAAHHYGPITAPVAVIPGHITFAAGGR